MRSSRTRVASPSKTCGSRSKSPGWSNQCVALGNSRISTLLPPARAAAARWRHGSESTFSSRPAKTSSDGGATAPFGDHEWLPKPQYGYTATTARKRAGSGRGQADSPGGVLSCAAKFTSDQTAHPPCDQPASPTRLVSTPGGKGWRSSASAISPARSNPNTPLPSQTTAPISRGSRRPRAAKLSTCSTAKPAPSNTERQCSLLASQP